MIQSEAARCLPTASNKVVPACINNFSPRKPHK